MASYLNPWLARHAVLVCSTVKVRLAAVMKLTCGQLCGPDLGPKPIVC